MEQKINIVEQFFGLITKISEWLDKFGIFKLFRTAFAVFLLYWIYVYSKQNIRGLSVLVR